MHPKVLRGLCKRNAPLLDQPHSLKLELLRKLPSLHDPPPAPSKHLTRCLRNRVQARSSLQRFTSISIISFLRSEPPGHRSIRLVRQLKPSLSGDFIPRKGKQYCPNQVS